MPTSKQSGGRPPAPRLPPRAERSLSPTRAERCAAAVSNEDVGATRAPGVGHRQSKPRSVRGPFRAPTRITVQPDGGDSRAGKLGPESRLRDPRRGSRAVKADTLCRNARGLSSEPGKEGRVRALRVWAPERVLAVSHLERAKSRRASRPKRGRNTAPPSRRRSLHTHIALRRSPLRVWAASLCYNHGLRSARKVVL